MPKFNKPKNKQVRRNIVMQINAKEYVPKHLRCPEAKEFVPKWKSSQAMEPVPVMFWQSAEEVESEKIAARKKFRGQQDDNVTIDMSSRPMSSKTVAVSPNLLNESDEEEDLSCGFC